MLFPSPEFLLVFLPLTLLGFHLLRLADSRRSACPGSSSPRGLLCLVEPALPRPAPRLDAGELGRRPCDGQAYGSEPPALFVLGLVWNLGILAYFKYADFFITSVDAVSGLDWPLLHVVLPLGISFFTFQKIAYLADIHAGLAKPGPLSDFALFVFFFPQLIAGPIVHHAEVMPQFRAMAAKGRDADYWLDTAVGLTLLVIGLVKKICVADQIAPYASAVFDHAHMRVRGPCGLAGSACLYGPALRGFLRL